MFGRAAVGCGIGGLVVGIALVAGGVLALGHWQLTRGWPGSGASLFSGTAFLLVGFLMLLNPNAGVAAVGVLLALFFLLDGGAKLMLGLATRGIPGAGWNLAHGAVSIVLAVMLLAGWPTSATWVIGLLAGLHLLLKGWAMLILGLSARALLGATR